MSSIHIFNNTITLNFARAASALGMKRSITFNSADLVKFSESNKSPEANEFRVFGIHIPFFCKVGSFYSFSKGNWEYWDVNYLSKGTYCEFQLKNQPYTRVVAKIDNLDAIRQLNSMGRSQ